MTANNLQVWTSELEHALQRMPRRERLYFRPRLIKLPAWFASGYGAWTLLGVVLITDTQAGCPADVRRYVVGHELGHLCGGHQYLQYLWILAQGLLLVGAAVAPAAALLGLALICVAFVGFVHPRWNLEREFFADRIAVELYGPHAMVTSAVWMSRQLGDSHTSERQARLQQLDSYLHSCPTQITDRRVCNLSG